MNHKILIIDAHPVYAPKTMGFLKGLTFKNIQLAISGVEGINFAQQDAPDLAILSANLPDISSYDVCRIIKRTVIPIPKIIIQTGLFISSEEVAMFKSCGADIIEERREKDLLPLHSAIEKLLFIKT